MLTDYNVITEPHFSFLANSIILNKVMPIFYNKGKGSLTPDEFFNVVKLQNGVDCTKDEVNIILYIFTGHISLENVFFFR